jgi:hypothetical protein
MASLHHFRFHHRHEQRDVCVHCLSILTMCWGAIFPCFWGIMLGCCLRNAAADEERYEERYEDHVQVIHVSHHPNLRTVYVVKECPPPVATTAAPQYGIKQAP